MKILFHANCQGEGLVYFMKHSPDASKIETRITFVYMIELGLVSKEESQSAIDWADIIFYHRVKGYEDPVKSGTESIALSVYNNSGYYISSSKSHDWQQVYDYQDRHGHNEAVVFALNEADMGYKRRYEANLKRMIEKETNEKVPREMWVSDLVQSKHAMEQQSLTYNHPTSFILFDWANIILRRLGLREIDCSLRSHLCQDLNAAKLPCVDWICSGARRQLNLSYGGSEVEDRQCAVLIHKKLKEKQSCLSATPAQ